jgi:hypothetical protein
MIVSLKQSWNNYFSINLSCYKLNTSSTKRTKNKTASCARESPENSSIILVAACCCLAPVFLKASKEL